jgi:hypothetical protein
MLGFFCTSYLKYEVLRTASDEMTPHLAASMDSRLELRRLGDKYFRAFVVKYEVGTCRIRPVLTTN